MSIPQVHYALTDQANKSMLKDQENAMERRLSNPADPARAILSHIFSLPSNNLEFNKPV